MMKSKNMFKHIGSVTIVAIFILLAFGSGDDDKKSDTDTKAATEETKKEQTPEELNEQLKKEIASFSKSFDNKGYDGSVEALQIEVMLFSLWTDVINKGEASSLEENVKLAKELRKKVETLQAREFPIIRQRYGKIMKDKMWEHDITIKTSGKGNTVLELAGGMFAANKNIKEYQAALDNALTMFRFKQTQYRWYKGASEYTYYDLETPSDKELVLISK